MESTKHHDMAETTPVSHTSDHTLTLHSDYNTYCGIVNETVTMPPEDPMRDLCRRLFRHQLFRLPSFNLDERAFHRYSVIQLAEDGFYKRPGAGEIQCFSCGYQHNVLRNEHDPGKCHRGSRGCLHLQGKDKNNVPWMSNIEAVSNLRGMPTLEHRAVNTTVTNHGHHRHDQNLERSDAAESRVHSSTNREQQTRLMHERESSDQRKRNLHRKVALRDYRYELCRFQSFAHWPSNAAANPEDLANAGFYYMGTDDRVQCVFCRGILRCWEPDDKPLAEHLRHFPQCPFLIDPQSTGNVPMGEEEESLFSTIQMRQGMNYSSSTGAATDSIISSTPYHPGKAHLSTRLGSFVDFPSNAFHTPEELAKAGFFYTGTVDRVCCYFCNVMISNWKSNDDPWYTHAVKSETCGYILLTKGQQFVIQAKQGIHNPNQRKSTRKKTRKGPSHHVSEERLESAMSSSTVRCIWDDYDVKLLKQVVKRRLQDLDDNFPNTESLMEAILEYEEDEAEEPLSGKEEDGAEDGENDQNKEPSNDQSSGTAEVTTRTNLTEINDTDEIPDKASLLQQREELLEENRCKVCLDERVSIVFLKCGHLVCCSTCAPALTKCPICREKILGTIRVDM